MFQAIIKNGKVITENIPQPIVNEGSVLIKVINSCLSAGTEISQVKDSGKSLIKKAIERPKQINDFINSIKKEGLIKTYNKINLKLKSGKPIGYSVSGIVIGTGKNINSYKIGDYVAAAGAGVANHAEFVDVPENLVVKMPKRLNHLKASTVAIGSIALHGVRRANLKLGEYCVVFGSGIIGLITIQLLTLSGIRVAVIDLNNYRLNIAKKLGAELVLNPSDADILDEIDNWTGGYGADCVLFTASTSSSEPLSKSFKMCRKKGKVVLVGISGMNIDRNDIYSKEIDLQISTSYGPGRYDKNYEYKGFDYPYSYVRWTENRNMSEYLRLISEGKINLDDLISRTFKIEEASKAFERLNKFSKEDLMIFLDYGTINKNQFNLNYVKSTNIKTSKKNLKNKIINVGIIGTGSFVKNMHIPNLLKLNGKYHIYAVCDKVGYEANNINKHYKINNVTTDYTELLNDNIINLIMVCTQHESHSKIVLDSLNAGKHVFVEKPLCINKEQLNKIKNYFNNNSSTPLLFVGYNRRFSKYAREIKKHISRRINPLFLHYRINAGYLPGDHWVFEQGGRIIGEACHIIDLMTYFTESRITEINAESITPVNNKFQISDNKSIILKYEDGSIATLEYFAVGNKDLNKEYMEIHFDGKSIIMDDYRILKGYGFNIKNIKTKKSEKGHLEELEILYNALIGNEEKWPIELWDMMQTSEVSLEL